MEKGPWYVSACVGVAGGGPGQWVRLWELCSGDVGSKHCPHNTAEPKAHGREELGTPVDVPANTCPFTCLQDSVVNFLGQIEESEAQNVPHKKWKALRSPYGLSVNATDTNVLVLVAATGWMNANKMAYFFFKPMAVNGRKGDFCLLANSSWKHRDHHNREEISTIYYCSIMPANDISTMPKLQTAFKIP